jgi:hypothetical protein
MLCNDLYKVGVMTIRGNLEGLEWFARRSLLLRTLLPGLCLILSARPSPIKLRSDQSRDREELRFRVRVKRLLSVEVNSQRRYAQDGPLNHHKLLSVIALPILDHDAPRDAQVPIEPRMPLAPSVRLDPDLQKSRARLLAHGLEAQRARVRVRAHHGDGVARLPFLAYAEGDEGGAVAGDVVLPPGLESRGPRVALLDLFEAGFG